jgi:hypothetical protein
MRLGFASGAWFSAALPLALTAACGDGATSSGTGGEGGGPAPIVCDPPASPPAFALGTGEACYEPLVDGQIVPMQAGPQAGYHFWAALGCTDCGAEVLIRYNLLDPTTMQAIPGTSPLNETYATLVGSEWPQAAGIQIGLPGYADDPANDPPLAKGTQILLKLSVLDGATGQTELHAASVTIELGDTVSWDPCDLHPEGDCCSSPCL